MRQTALLFLIVLGSLAMATFVWGETLMVAIYGVNLAGTGLIVGVLAINALANAMAIVIGNVMWALNQPRANLPGDILTHVAMLGLAIVLIPQFGILGAALGSAMGTTIGAAFRWWQVRNYLARAER